MADHVGKILGSYQLTRLIGRGGYAEVYLADRIDNKREKFAVKVLHSYIEDERIKQEFLGEAKRLAALDHPHIVRLVDYDVQDMNLYIVMSYAPAGNLDQQYPIGEKMPIERIRRYVKQIADALQYAHEMRLAHLDLKPKNILLGYNDVILLGDFGLARIIESTSRQTTQQQVAGTWLYAAPEQFKGNPRLESDQYALGVIVYQWLSGNPPFRGSGQALMFKHIVVPPPSLREKGCNISEELEEVVFKALEKEYKKRFESIQAFATALEKACRSPYVTAPLPPNVKVAQIDKEVPPLQALVSAEESRGEEVANPISTLPAILEEEAWSAGGDTPVVPNQQASGSTEKKEEKPALADILLSLVLNLVFLVITLALIITVALIIENYSFLARASRIQGNCPSNSVTFATTDGSTITTGLWCSGKEEKIFVLYNIQNPLEARIEDSVYGYILIGTVFSIISFIAILLCYSLFRPSIREQVISRKIPTTPEDLG